MAGIFNKKVDVQRATVTQDTQATPVDSWTSPSTVASGVPASIQSIRPAEVMSFSQRGIDADFYVYTGRATAAVQDDRIPDPDTGEFYRVIEVRDMAGRGRMFQHVCKRIS